jgi:hypothetical protein
VALFIKRGESLFQGAWPVSPIMKHLAINFKTNAKLLNLNE